MVKIKWDNDSFKWSWSDIALLCALSSPSLGLHWRVSLSGLVREPNQITYLTHTRHNRRCAKTGNSYCRHLVTLPQVGNISKKQWKGTCCMQRVGRILPQASFAFPNIVKAGPPVSFCSLRWGKKSPERPSDLPKGIQQGGVRRGPLLKVPRF